MTAWLAWETHLKMPKVFFLGNSPRHQWLLKHAYVIFLETTQNIQQCVMMFCMDFCPSCHKVAKWISQMAPLFLVEDKNPFEFANCSLLDVITNHFCSSLIVNHNKISKYINVSCWKRDRVSRKYRMSQPTDMHIKMTVMTWSYMILNKISWLMTDN